MCLTILLDIDSLKYFKQNDQVLWRRLFIWACEGLSIHKALHIDVWEMAGVTAMAAGGEQTQRAHACDVSLGAKYAYALNHSNIQHMQAWCAIAAPLSLICLRHRYSNSENTVRVGLLRILRFVVVRLSKSLTILRLGSSNLENKLAM